MILKLLIIAAVIGIVYFMFFKAKPVEKKEHKKTSNKTQVNDMTECVTCGVYVEIDEAILSNGKYYCSRECLTKAQ